MYYVNDEHDEIYYDDDDYDYEEVEYDLKVVFKTNLGREGVEVVNHHFDINGNGWWEDLTGEGHHHYFWEADDEAVCNYVKELKGIIKGNKARELLQESVYDQTEFEFEDTEEIVEFVTVEFA